MKHIKHVRHGESKTRLYRIWSNLKNRVLPNSVKAKYYFDRGIGLCDEWKNSFTSFRDWSINNGYDDKLTLDRIDNDGSYTPENCRWVDMKVQSNNRSNNISVRIEEGCIPFSEICRVLSIDYMYAYNKVVKHLSQEIGVERTVKNWKEPVSEDLGEYINELSKQFPEVSFAKLSRIAVRVAKWQKKQDQSTIELAEDHAMLAGMEKMKEQMTKDLWKPADGDDLPEHEREVVAFQETFPTDVDVPSLFKIVIAHRPNPEGYDGKSLSTGKVEHYTPKTYGEGGWNIPDVKWWLDVKLPKEIEL